MTPAKKAATRDDAPDGLAIDPDLAQLSYEDARDELVDVVRRLESGGETLEASLALWQRGEALATHCEQWLAGARARIEAAQSQRTSTE